LLEATERSCAIGTKPVQAPLFFVRAREQVFEGRRNPLPWLRPPGARTAEHTADASHFTVLKEPAVGRVAKSVAGFLAEFLNGAWALLTTENPA
jgi:hypothetical protein